MFRQKRDNFIPLLSNRKYWWLACKCYCIGYDCVYEWQMFARRWGVEYRGQVVTSGGDPSTGRRLSIFIRVKYILKYTNRHIRKNCPLIISLASAAAEGTQSRRHHSNVNLGSMLNINLSFHYQPKHKQCILLCTCGHIISIIHLLLHLVDLSTTEFY